MHLVIVQGHGRYSHYGHKGILCLHGKMNHYIVSYIAHLFLFLLLLLLFIIVVSRWSFLCVVHSGEKRLWNEVHLLVCQGLLLSIVEACCIFQLNAILAYVPRL